MITCSSAASGVRTRKSAAPCAAPARAGAGPLPGRDVGEVIVIAPASPSGRLALHAIVAAARLVALQCVNAHQSFGKLQEISQPAGFLQRLVQLSATARNPQIVAKLLLSARESSPVRVASSPRTGPFRSRPRTASPVPGGCCQPSADPAFSGVRRCDPGLRFGLTKRGLRRVDLLQFRRCQVVRQGAGQMK